MWNVLVVEKGEKQLILRHFIINKSKLQYSSLAQQALPLNIFSIQVNNKFVK